MKATPKESTRHIEAVQKALAILDCFQDAPELSVAEIGQRLGIYRSRAMRLAGTLEAGGYLVRNPENSRYRLGAQILSLAAAFERSHTIRDLVRPVLRRLAAETGESVALYVPEGLRRVVLVREEGTSAIRYSVSEGKTLHLWAGAGGKAILAFSPPEVVDAVLAGERTPLTPKTVTASGPLLAELERIRSDGYALSFGERYPEANGIAAPIFGARHRLIGSVSVVAPAHRMVGDAARTVREKVVAAGREISGLLGALQEKNPVPPTPGNPPGGFSHPQKVA